MSSMADLFLHHKDVLVKKCIEKSSQFSSVLAQLLQIIIYGTQMWDVGPITCSSSTAGPDDIEYDALLSA